MKFCAKCGQKLSDDEDICHNCGYDFRSRLDKAKSKKKIVTLIVMFLIVCGMFYAVYNKVSNPLAVVSKLNKAINTSEQYNISNIFYCKDSRLKIDDNNIKILINFLKENPQDTSFIMKNLYMNAIKLKNHKKLPELGKWDNWCMKLKRIGNKLGVFPVYKIEIKPYFINVKTKVKDVEFWVDNKNICKSNSYDFNKKFGPFILGKHTVLAKYNGKYVKLSESNDIEFKYNTLEEVEVLKDLVYTNIDGKYKDAEIFINDKNTKVKIKDGSKFGILNDNTKIYAVINKNGKKIKSKEYITNHLENYIFLDFPTN